MRANDKVRLLRSIEKAIKDVTVDAERLSRLYLSTLAPFINESYQLSLAGKAVTETLISLLAAKEKLIEVKKLLDGIEATP